MVYTPDNEQMRRKLERYEMQEAQDTIWNRYCENCGEQIDQPGRRKFWVRTPASMRTTSRHPRGTTVSAALPRIHPAIKWVKPRRRRSDDHVAERAVTTSGHRDGSERCVPGNCRCH